MNVSAHTELEKQKQNKLFPRSGLRNTALMYNGHFFFFVFFSTLADNRYLIYSSSGISRGKMLPVFPASSIKLVAKEILL